jgi:hypothetical protein
MKLGGSVGNGSFLDFLHWSTTFLNKNLIDLEMAKSVQNRHFLSAKNNSLKIKN